MSFVSLKIFFLVNFVSICSATGIWRNGAVRYSIRSEDYDTHSKQIISSVFRKIQQESCLRFHLTEIRTDSVSMDKHLYIHNEDKKKHCLPGNYDYNNKVIKMAIGYDCLNEQGITKTFIDMLKAGVATQSVNHSNTSRYYEGPMKMSDTDHLLTLEDHIFLDKHYKKECKPFKSNTIRRQMDSEELGMESGLTPQNEAYYSGKIWPFGIVMYHIDNAARAGAQTEVLLLKLAMGIIEKQSCIAFEDVSGLNLDELRPNNKILFDKNGPGIPELGFRAGIQNLGITAFTVPITPAHSGHLLLSLMRVLGVPLESNRFDRDYYVDINRDNIIEDYGIFFEKDPEEANLNMPYDFDSVTHPPVNWLCKNLCNMGQQTIQPHDDFQWKMTMSIGHNEALSTLDALKLKVLYRSECNKRDGSPAMS